MKRVLYTWLDVDMVADERRGAGQWPQWLTSASSYHDGLQLVVLEDVSLDEVDHLLDDWYGARYEQGRGLLLQSIPGQERLFPVSVERVPAIAERGTSKTVPTFRRVALLPEDAEIQWPEPFPAGSPQIVAFYSYKGGVGRTTSLLAFLSSLGARDKGMQSLIIDADLEAPGITSLVEAGRQLGANLFSFVDLLALCHSDASSDFEAALTLAANEIRGQQLGVRTGDRDAQHYFMPAYRDQTQSLRLDIRPEHLIAEPSQNWILADILRNLAERLEVDVVLLDLRAGISELAAPFVFDPRIRRVLVTTPSQQSLVGTETVLSQLKKLRPPEDRPEFYDPSVLISFVLPELANGDELQQVRRRLLSCYPDPIQASESPLSRLQIRDTSFSQELLYLPTFAAAMDRISRSSMPSVLSLLVEEFIATDTESVVDAVSVEAARKSVADFAKRLEFAESGGGNKFLAIAPLRALAHRFESKSPVAVIIGSKGSGKTYTWLQILNAGSWSGFISSVARQPLPARRTDSQSSGLLWPLLHSANLSDSVKELVLTTRRSSATALQLPSPVLTSIEIEDRVKEALLHQGADERWWRMRWLSLIAASLGVEFSTDNEAAGRLVQELRSRSLRVVVMIDGLEDLFPSLDRNESQQLALRALLQGVPAYLSEVPDCPLGVLVFVRADLVTSAIPQNVGQFERLYEAFALRWNEEEALRLAVWISREGGAVVPPINRELEVISAEEAREALFAVWGRKLGTERSREARTAEWVLAALSDFKGQVQARDLVRFFRFSAEKSAESSQADRLLTPRAIRDAILPCSAQKIREIEQEIPALREIFSKLQEATDRRIPFGAASSGLTVEQIQFLIKAGVLIEDSSEFFMPEIFRLGLGFQLASGARPRVLSFARRK